MKIRIRGPSGQSTITLADDALVQDLQAQITEKTLIIEYDVKYGYPPKPLLLHEHSQTSKLADLGIRLNGEQLIISENPGSQSTESISLTSKLPASPNQKGPETATKAPSAPQNISPGKTDSTPSRSKPSPRPPATATSKTSPLPLTRKPPALDAPELPLPSHGATLLLRIMPDDNSCLFRAFNSAFFGSADDHMPALRAIVAQHIHAHPDTYPAVVLERSADDYCRWIRSADAWGGAIELDILSRHFEVEICSVDVQSLRVDRFNEGRPRRCILVYSGIHYDTIALSPSNPPHDRADAPPEFDTKVFDAADEEILAKAVELGRVLNAQHYFTDTASFSVLCNVCRESFTGEKGATDHARKTGHYDFGEA